MLALVAANLVPLVGVLWLGWEIFPLMFLFWSENVIVGGFNVLKMLTASGGGLAGHLGKLFLIPFFFVHYGMFTMVHGVFVVGLFGGQFRHGASFPDEHFFWSVIEKYHLGWAILGLIVSHGISFVTNYIGKGEFRRASVQQLMQQPYGRIVVMHLAILGGAFLMAALHSPVWGLVFLIALKIALDVREHLKERNKFAATPGGI